MSLDRCPVVVASDIHLARETPAATARDLARLCDVLPGMELVLAGDVFDLSVVPRGASRVQEVLALLDRHPAVVEAWRAHLAAGRRLTLLAGNHDADTMVPEMRQALLARLELGVGAPLELVPWFVRRGQVHIEHGHAYDPDNAPSHPLALWSERTEPLGISLTRRFLAPSRAMEFAHAHATTPLGGLLRAFRLFGPRAPWVVARYFHAAAMLTLEAGPRTLGAVMAELDAGAARLPAFADQVGLDASVLGELHTLRARPRHLSQRDTFMRLYFDRVLATVAAALGVPAGLAGSPVVLSLALASAAYVAGSVLLTGSRYGAGPAELLRVASSTVRAVTGARLVVFGHTHGEDEAPGYLNCGTFGFSSSRRPHLVVSPDGSAERRHLPAMG